jgi:mediator of RNA polymerase II transcription subunit 14
VQILREVYAYCCARVAHTQVEKQLKQRMIPYAHVAPPGARAPAGVPAHLHAALARAVPALCVPAARLLGDAPGADAAEPNVRVLPLNWWSARAARVVTCVKLRHVQPPLGSAAAAASAGAVVRLSKRIVYDAAQAVVSFLSEDVDRCVDEFLEEWGKVSKMVVIAREGWWLPCCSRSNF